MVKNIVFVTPYFAPAWSYGGPPRVFFTLARELAKKGKNVKVVSCDTLDKRRNLRQQEVLDGIEIFRFRTVSNILSYKLKLFIVPRLLDKSEEILNWADIVLMSDVRTIINWQLYPYLVKKNIPYGIFAFGEIPVCCGLKVVIKRLFDKLWVKDMLDKATFRFAQTTHEQEMFKSFFDIPTTKTHILPLPIDNKKKLIKSEEISKFKERWSIEEKDKIILFVGRLHYLKGIDILIKSVRELFDRYQNLKLMIVGSDEGQERILKNLVGIKLSNNIIFTGSLYGNELIKAYLISSFFAFTPRFFEETSLAALTALQYGIPVVTTKQAQIPYLEDYKAGFTIENDILEIKKAINKLLLMSKIEHDKMKKQAKKLISDHFTSDKIAVRLLSYLETIG